MFSLSKGMMPSRLLPRLRLQARSYSDAAPLYKIHNQLKDVEHLFQKYKLNELNTKESIDALVRNGTISKHIGEELNHDLKVQQEAGSKILAGFFYVYSLNRDC